MSGFQLGGSRAGEPGRGTTQRSAVMDALAATDRFRTAQDLHSELRTRGVRIGLTTVYRHLQKLADDGVIHAVQTVDRQTAYRLCSQQPHHHLVCKACGAGIEIADPDLDTRVQAQAIGNGYSEISHRVEIFGVCSECSARTQAKYSRRA